jgi:adenosylcobinamide kinase / adenosylcobinamide-phosphate guanylyltransferase
MIEIRNAALSTSRVELTLGGARSGKSRYAEQIATHSGLECIYLATAQAGDAEMAERIRLHRAQRSGFVETIEEPLALAQAIAATMHEKRCVLVDCLTLWLTNLLLRNDENFFIHQRAELFTVIAAARGHIIFVSNEVGQGVVPIDPLSRRFVDESGRLHQDIAARCNRVVFVTAGLPTILKDSV